MATLRKEGREMEEGGKEGGRRTYFLPSHRKTSLSMSCCGFDYV
jgi:hypothetical protein